MRAPIPLLLLLAVLLLLVGCERRELPRDGAGWPNAALSEEAVALSGGGQVRARPAYIGFQGADFEVEWHGASAADTQVVLRVDGRVWALASWGQVETDGRQLHRISFLQGGPSIGLVELRLERGGQRAEFRWRI